MTKGTIAVIALRTFHLASRVPALCTLDEEFEMAAEEVDAYERNGFVRRAAAPPYEPAEPDAVTHPGDDDADAPQTVHAGVADEEDEEDAEAEIGSTSNEAPEGEAGTGRRRRRRKST